MRGLNSPFFLNLRNMLIEINSDYDPNDLRIRVHKALANVKTARKEIAKTLGVSTTTVSYVLTGKRKDEKGIIALAEDILNRNKIDY